MTTYVSYIGDGEIIVCTKREEKALVEELFKGGSQRDIEQYKRQEHKEGPGAGFVIGAARKMW